MPKTGPEFIAAKMAERDERHRSDGQYPLRGRAQYQGRQGRACATCIRCSGSASTFYQVKTSAELVGKGVLSAEEYRLFVAGRGFPLGPSAATCISSPVVAEEKLTFDVQPDLAERMGYARARRHAGGRALHEALLPRRQGCGRPDPHLLHLARIQPRQTARHGGRVLAPFRSRQGGDQGRDRFRARYRPAERRRRRTCFRRTPSTSSRGSCWPAGTSCTSIPMRSSTSPLVQADRTRAQGRPAGQRAVVPRDPDRADLCRAHPAPDERERRARPLRARFRQDRRADAVQHVPPLHGGRAPDPRRRRHGRYRQWRAARPAAADPRAAAAAQRHAPALRGAVPARHRQGPAGGSLDRRRPDCAKVLPALRDSTRPRPTPSPGWSSITS
jgi:hypothetical protein